MTWYIRPMQPQEEEPFLSLLGAWVKEISVRKRYQWLYQNNPHGRALTWLAIDNQTERMVGCTTLFPKKLWLHDRVIVGAVGGDTYVDPLWRRKGIAEALHRSLIKGMKENGIRFNYGFLLEENLRAYCRAGAYVPGNFLSARLFLSLKPFLRKVKLEGAVPQRICKILDKIFLKVTGPGALRFNDMKHFVREFKSFDESFETLTQEVVPFFKICGVRDCSYLRWRFLDNPFKNYTLMKVVRKEDSRLDGFAAIEISGQSGYVSDFFARPEDDIVEALLIGVIHLGVSHSLHSISLTVNPVGSYCHNFTRCGFRFKHSDQKTLGVQKILEVLSDDSGNDNLENLKDLKNWYLTSSDLDL